MPFPAFKGFCHPFSHDFGGLVWATSSSLKSSVLSLLGTSVVPSLWTLPHPHLHTHSSVNGISLPVVPWLYWSKTERRRKAITCLKVPSEGNNQKTNRLECPFSFILCWCIRIIFYFCASKPGQKSSNMTEVTRVCFSAGSFVLVLWLALKLLLWIIHNGRKHYILLKNLLNHVFQKERFGARLGKAEESDHIFPVQKWTAAASDWATSLSMQCVKLITPLTCSCLITLTCPEISTPCPKVHCSLSCYSAPYCIGSLTENLKCS